MQGLSASTQRAEAVGIDSAQGQRRRCSVWGRRLSTQGPGALTQGGGADAGPGGRSLNKKEPSQLALGERELVASGTPPTRV
jgi:hypothetical protein